MWTHTFYARYREHATYHKRPAYTEAEENALRKTLRTLAVSTRHIHPPVVFPSHHETVPGRCLEGLIAACFDGGYVLVFVLTPPGANLAEQTLHRLQTELMPFHADNDGDDPGALFFNILSAPPPENFTRFMRSRKMIFVVPKLPESFARLHALLVEAHPDLSYQKSLFVDLCPDRLEGIAVLVTPEDQPTPHSEPQPPLSPVDESLRQLRQHCRWSACLKYPVPVGAQP